MEAIVCDCDKLCIRQGPSKDANILTIVDVNTVLQCANSDSDGWYSVTQINDVPAVGYCMSKYTKVIKEPNQSADRNEVKNGRRT